jgi:prefoldin subunit 5
MKKSIDKSLEPKPKEDSVVDELVVETIPELIDSIDTINSQMKNIDSQIDTLTDVISSYEEALRKAEEDKANYKKLVQELTK